MDTPVSARPTIPLVPVESSQINAIGYDPAAHILAIQFKAKAGPGATYQYDAVPQETFDDFRNAESIGRYFGQHIKNNPAFPFTRVAEPPPADDKPVPEDVQ